MVSSKLDSSFRDPSGFLFRSGNRLLRQVNQVYKSDFDLVTKSKLYEHLVAEDLLIRHKEVAISLAASKDVYKIIEPEKIPFITYPYEWSFSQLKDAALTTLKIQKIAMEHGLSLKDASSFNIQFHKGKPILIDSLSFEKYLPGKPWIAYKQFCQHFLAPLALAAYEDIRLTKLLQIHLDGIPLDLVSKLLPLKSRINFPVLVHVHLHAASQKRYADKGTTKAKQKSAFSKRSFLALIDSLESAVNSLKWQPAGTEWSDYYDTNNNYVPVALKEKASLVADFLDQVPSKTVWDLGGNTGLFSRLASDKGIATISFDIDEAAVEKNYLEMKKRHEENLLPLLLDLTNPTPPIGWKNKERDSFLERGPADTAFALALIHHLAISNNLPLAQIAEYFSSLCKFLIIEFVPKEDSQVQKLLSSRKDIFPYYTKEDFEREFSAFFTIQRSQIIPRSKRILYLMTKGSRGKK